MSTFTTRNGLPVVCTGENCPCNAPAAVTRGAVDAAAEEKWFAELVEAIDEWTRLDAEYEAAPKSERDRLAAELHQAKNDIIDRFRTKETGK